MEWHCSKYVPTCWMQEAKGLCEGQALRVSHRVVVRDVAGSRCGDGKRGHDSAGGWLMPSVVSDAPRPQLGRDTGNANARLARERVRGQRAAPERGKARQRKARERSGGGRAT